MVGFYCFSPLYTVYNIRFVHVGVRWNGQIGWTPATVKMTLNRKEDTQHNRADRMGKTAAELPAASKSGYPQPASLGGENC